MKEFLLSCTWVLVFVFVMAVIFNFGPALNQHFYGIDKINERLDRIEQLLKK